ncbi:MAG: hypothetical protein MK033_04530 [Candidatus Caenarcaniphilales bacterium]|nr:hypothetical protein [Candidatus Caenarcaniphilales bacterium]
MKELIIIPGAGSSKLNWMDQILSYESNGFRVDFFDYQVEYCNSFTDLETQVLGYLKKILKISSAQNISERTIVAHSMGAMVLVSLLMKLANSDLTVGESFLDELKSHKIFLVQMPITTNTKLLNGLKASSPLIKTMIQIHKPFENPVSDYLSNLKTKSKIIFEPLRDIADLIWILSAMHISAYTTHEDAFMKMIEFYDSWNLLSSSNTQYLKSFDIAMTVSNSDIFVTREEALEFAEMISAKTRDFDWTFHNPMHFPWSQKDFANWVLDS